MTAPLIENVVDEPPPLRRAVVGVVLGLVVGGLAAVALPRERRDGRGGAPATSALSASQSR